MRESKHILFFRSSIEAQMQEQEVIMYNYCFKLFHDTEIRIHEVTENEYQALYKDVRA